MCAFVLFNLNVTKYIIPTKVQSFVCLPNLNQGSRLPEDMYKNFLLDGIRFAVVAFFIFCRSTE